MKRETLPPLKETYGALENAGLDLYGFAMVLHAGNTATAEAALLDTLLMGLENDWFTETVSQGAGLTHNEFREDFFKDLWHRSRGASIAPRLGTEVPLGHDEMNFYRLPQLVRAALFLRTKKQLPYASLALILGQAEEQLRKEVERAREFLLGRQVRAFTAAEEDF